MPRSATADMTHRLRDLLDGRSQGPPAAWVPQPQPVPAPAATPAPAPVPAPAAAAGSPTPASVPTDIFALAVPVAQAQVSRNTQPASADYLATRGGLGLRGYLRRWKYRRYFTHRYLEGTVGGLVEIKLTDGSTISGRYWAHRSKDDAVVLVTGRPGEPPVLLTPADVDAVHVLLPGGSASTFAR